MEVGNKILLHTNLSPGRNSSPDEIVVITIQETKEVPNMWGKGTGKGLRATDEQGREYHCNWTSFPDDSMTPYAMWIRIKPSQMFWDVTQDHMTRPPFTPWFIGKKGYEFIEYCEKHQNLFYPNRGGISDGCFDCYMEKEYGQDRSIKRDVHETWVGWKEPV